MKGQLRVAAGSENMQHENKRLSDNIPVMMMKQMIVSHRETDDQGSRHSTVGSHVLDDHHISNKIKSWSHGLNEV